MNIEPFAVEEWMNKYEVGAKYNIAETCVDSVSLDELFELTGTDKKEFLEAFCARRLTYGDIEGLPALKKGICSLYKTLSEEEIVTTHGASGANHHVFYTLVQPGDRVISITPTYQQLYSIPESYGADVQFLHLTKENGYLPDLEELKKLLTPNTKLICINNPNNPTGALMSRDLLCEIAALAKGVDAYVLCDEVYRHLTQEDEWCESIVDLYDKGISVSSMSKVFSLAGLRLGWIASHDQNFIRSCFSHRDYNLVSCGLFDEAVASIALQNKEILLQRNRKMVRNNLAILDQWVASEPLVHYQKPQAGTTALVFYDLPIPSVEFCDRMYHETGAFVTPGDCFEEAFSMRIGYACEEEVLRAGLKAISQFIESRKGE
ncbi:MAG: aminotransferase [Eubacteriales bacterium]|nr:aminotransferase [Eubacteriales bacterium]